jgi:hypothetical protein
MIGRGLLCVVSGAFLASCGGPVVTPRGTPPPPVACSDYPAERLDVVSCRYLYKEQLGEVWARSRQLAAPSAVSLGASHIQWLSLETHVETVRANSLVDCTRTWLGAECTGTPYETPVGLISVTRFALLSPEEAAARLSDPLIPVERRPIDARSIALVSAH